MRYRTLAGCCLLLGSAHAPAGLVSIDVRGGEVAAVLQQVADQAGLQLLAPDGLHCKVSLRLRRLSADEALAALLPLCGLGSEQRGSLLRVAPLDELSAQARQALAWELAREGRLPLRTELLPLRHARAGELEKLLSAGTAGDRLLGPRGRVLVDARSNTLIVSDHAARLAQLRDWLAALDRPGRQVLIETRLALVSRTRAESLGARWQLQAGAADGRSPLGLAGEVASLRYGLLGVDAGRLDLELSALEAEGQGEVIARPSVMTGELQKARIASGQQIPYQETTYSGATSTRFVNAELSLEVTPAISPDGWIQLDLALSHDSPGEIQASGARAIDTNRLSSQVRIRDGQTLMLGGIFRSQDSRTVSRVPGLGNIPLLGSLFRRQLTRQDKQELLVFVTPRLVDEPPLPASAATGSTDAASAN